MQLLMLHCAFLLQSLEYVVHYIVYGLILLALLEYIVSCMRTSVPKILQYILECKYTLVMSPLSTSAGSVSRKAEPPSHRKKKYAVNVHCATCAHPLNNLGADSLSKQHLGACTSGTMKNAQWFVV